MAYQILEPLVVEKMLWENMSQFATIFVMTGLVVIEIDKVGVE